MLYILFRSCVVIDFLKTNPVSYILYKPRCNLKKWVHSANEHQCPSTRRCHHLRRLSADSKQF